MTTTRDALQLIDEPDLRATSLPLALRYIHEFQAAMDASPARSPSTIATAASPGSRSTKDNTPRARRHCSRACRFIDRGMQAIVVPDDGLDRARVLKSLHPMPKDLMP